MKKMIEIPVIQPNINLDLLINNLKKIPEIEDPEEFVLDQLIHGLYIEYEDTVAVEPFLNALKSSGVTFKFCDESTGNNKA